MSSVPGRLAEEINDNTCLMHVKRIKCEVVYVSSRLYKCCLVES